MLAAAQRLRRSGEFAVAVRGGRRAGRGAVVVHLDLPSASPSVGPETATPEPVRPAGTEQDSAPARAGFVVSKAVGGAVVRNSVRRRLRHLVRERLTTLPAGTTLVVRALPGAADLTYDRLAADLDAALAAARRPRRSGRRPE
ncbi:ribonuclease P protein component [Micromonospora sp. NBC_01796]|uniref:ribonuclease P protein component n=1 Tax=Micromonospora sp. NBC_01796 TaxID=2975987 RepID=UPI002DD9BA20|nr:ribonuclease P protein component [Micromonospora sp. NBC_01796]WSA88555.1 ribonuclease P protein component [Micromonospora sp. NBC_01796]